MCELLYMEFATKRPLSPTLTHNEVALRCATSTATAEAPFPMFKQSDTVARGPIFGAALQVPFTPKICLLLKKMYNHEAKKKFICSLMVKLVVVLLSTPQRLSFFRTLCHQ